MEAIQCTPIFQMDQLSPERATCPPGHRTRARSTLDDKA